jgi:pyruvate formate lyase activating enzyme
VTDRDVGAAGGRDGLTFNVQRFAVHDGPGVRTLIFLKGCPLRCLWCANPESQRPTPEPGFLAGRCLGLDRCRLCLDQCPHGALAAGPGRPVLDRAVCGRCRDFACRRACPAGALIVWGRRMTPEEAVAEAEKDAVFQRRSKGGLTLSGGEPLAQPEFALSVLELAKRRRLTTALETSGWADFEILKAAAPLLDFVLYDVKLVDRRRHEATTGRGNEVILGNLRRLAELRPGPRLKVRAPVVPGVNDCPQAAADLGRLLARLPSAAFEALPYHALGRSKYEALDRPYPMGQAKLAEGALEAFRAATESARAAGPSR